MKNTLIRSLPGLFALLPAIVLAQSVPLAQDTYFVAGSSTTFGSAVTLNVIGGDTPSQALVQFDLSRLPTTIPVLKATLMLYVDRVVTPGSVSVSVASGNWQEATVSGTNNTPAPGALVNGSVAVDTANLYISVDATTAVQNWLSGTTANNGFILTPNSTVSVTFDSKESLATSHAAMLTVILNGPAGPTGAAGTHGSPGANGAAGQNGAPGAAGPRGPQGLSGTDPQSCIPQLAALLRCGFTQTYPVGAYPNDIAFDGTNIWVANQGANSVSKLLASTGATVGTYPLGNNTSPTGIAFDGTNIWVSEQGTNMVTKLVAATGAIVGSYPTGSGPYPVIFDGTNIWVANYNSANVTKLLASTGATLGTYPVGSNPIAMTFDGTNIWVANYASNNVTELVASTGATVNTFPAGTGPDGITFDGTNVWVANFSSHNVTKLSAGTGAMVGSYSVGAQPAAIAFDGTNIWVANYGDNTLTGLLASTGATVGPPIATGSSPTALGFDGTNLCVVNYDDADIMKFPIF